jgi:hypothetical protein
MPFYHPTLEEGLQAALYDMKSKMDYKSDELLELRLL